VRTIEGKARVLDPGTVGISTGEILKARNIVIATGSRPWSPPIRGTDLDGVVTTRQILDLEKAPQTLVIIGGGIIGQEFAAIFSALGCRVTVLEALGTILSEVDSEIAKKYASLLPGRGIVTEVGVTVQAIEKTQARLRVVYEKKSKEKVAEADLVLMATGRRPYWESSGIGNLGLDVGHGAIPVDRFLRTPLEGIYAVGDVVGGKMLAHVASYHGEIVAENIAGRERTAEDNLVPSCLFTLPQIAWVGPTEQEILTSGRSFRSSTFSLSASGKALADGDSRGWIKLIEDGESRRLIGAHLMGPHVSELIGGLTLAVKKGMSATDIADTIHPHPTISEAVREAALGLLDGSIHASSRLSSLPDQRRDAIPANVR
jgi:dihydrolipoamide dehydrogenase